MTLYQYVKILTKYFPRLKYIFKERDHQRPKRGTLSISKAKKLLNYKPHFNLEKGMKKYVEFAKSFKEVKK